MDLMIDWEYDADRLSFEDSPFEEDSLCSIGSESESVANNWRGWKRQNGGPNLSPTKERHVTPLAELSAKAVARYIPFEVVEHFPIPIPEPLQLRIAFWSFPESEEDIRLYSCLANGSADEFIKGESLYKYKCVKDTLQIGFHLSGTVLANVSQGQSKGSFNVAVVFDRCMISSNTCTCVSSAFWCSHVVALCLFRIHQAGYVCLRAPVSESLSRLHRDQLQKFAQYLISELPQQILPTAQQILDELLSSQETAMNTVCGAPDPTAGPSASEQTSWSLDVSALHSNIKNTLVKFCIPSPIVFSDVNYLTASAPPAATEWTSLLRPLRGREPEGMWNLLSIVREMFRRNDSNSIPLLEILTDEVLQCEQLLIWWFSTKVSPSNNATVIHCSRGTNSAMGTQNAASSLCEEIVTLWRLGALNPKLSPYQRKDMLAKFRDWHVSTIEKVRKARSNTSNSSFTGLKKGDVETFSGFKPAVEACALTWDDYSIPGVTYSETDGSRFFYHFGSNKLHDSDAKKPSRVQPVTICSQDIISSDNPNRGMNNVQRGVAGGDVRQLVPFRRDSGHDGAMSSGSEGFCEPERGCRDSDSSGDSKGLFSRSNSFEEVDLSRLAEAKASSSSSRNGLESSVFVAEGASKSGSLEGKDMAAVNASMSKLSVNAEGRVTGAEAESSDRMSLADSIAGGAIPKHLQRRRGNPELPRANSAAAPTSSSSTPPPPPATPSTSSQPQRQQPQQQPEGDEYQMYFYDTKAKPEQDKKKKDKNEEPNMFAGLRSVENMQDILFSRAEALHAHGHTKEACCLAQKLGEEMLASPPDLLSESATVPSPKSKKKKALTNISLLASGLLSKASFLCSVLIEDEECYHLAFKIGMFGIELARPPASNKALEVKLAHQEYELLQLLKRIILGPREIAEIKYKAEQLRDNTLKSRGGALLPLSLASFIFDVLCVAGNTYSMEENLGFEASVFALGMKANIAEADHPLLCESTRRQKGELATTMLLHYKDDQVKLSLIMEKLLDKEMHQQYKAPPMITYLSGHKHISTGSASNRGGRDVDGTQGSSGASSSRGQGHNKLTAPDKSSGGATAAERSANSLDHNEAGVGTDGATAAGGALGAGGTRPKTFSSRYISGRDTDSSAMEEEDDSKALEAKIRCMGMKKKPSQGMASIDSSAPETTSSDNSPTMVRRNFGKHQGPGSDSGSSGESDSLGSSSSGDKAGRAAARDNESPPSPRMSRMILPQFLMDSRGQMGGKNIRYKGRQRLMPTVPNQPSEAGYHFMFELAKKLLQEAGGSSSTSLFTEPRSTTSHTGPHRNLHLCAFQIGLYALGLSNCVSPNWLSRTYSSHVSWIAGQAIEIGSAAIRMIIDTWEGHLTPPEAASLADRASRGRDPTMVRVASELALSCLPHAHALNISEVQLALNQCKEQSRDMLEKACLAVETAAEGGGVFPEVLFDVAHHWFELSEEASQNSPDSVDGSDSSGHTLRARRESGSPASLASTDPGSASDRASPSTLMAPSVSMQRHMNQLSSLVMSPQTPPPGQMMRVTPTSSPQQQIQSPAGGSHHIPPQAVVLVPAGAPPPPHHHHHHPATFMQQFSYTAPPPTPTGAYSPHHHHHGHQFNQSPHQSSPQPLHHLNPCLHHTTAYVASYTTYPTHQPGTGSPGNFPTLPPGAAIFQTGPPANLRSLPPTVQVFTTQPHHHHHHHQQQQQQMAAAMHSLHQNHPADVMANSSPTNKHHLPQSPVSASPHNNTGNQQGSGAVLLLPQVQNVPSTHNQLQLNYMMAAFRVGMLAMETLSRKVHDDRPVIKYSRNPAYGEDVKWLLTVAIKLGTTFLQQFCASAVNAVVSPFVLYDLAMEAARYLARNNPTHVPTQLRSNILNSLFQKCLQMFMQCAHQRIHHISNSDYDDFVSIVCNARNAFYLAPGGIVQFNELLQSLRRSKSCRKELWQRIVNGLSTGTMGS